MSDRSSDRTDSLETGMFNVGQGSEQVQKDFLPNFSVSHKARRGQFCEVYALQALNSAIDDGYSFSTVGTVVWHHIRLVQMTRYRSSYLRLTLLLHVKRIAITC
jgi:hypothetical protein